MKKPRLQHTSLPFPPGAQDQARAFYGGVLGLEEKPTPTTIAHHKVVWFGAGDSEMELHLFPDSEHPAHPQERRHICLEVEDLDAFRHKLEAAGCSIDEEDPIPHRPRFFSRDPFGNRIEFTSILGNYQEVD
ncbi:glyoxalase [Ktedonosporobacter rubrisoli]|uniref:Glyoxalase n=1 Tax=Ktedonosporobacter rubrisoli TaxID=2509675 RepID=A0A4P6JT91_KTERU|nr:VOC family protein [Ktedonosporobacter rubrisoli]QBD78472.1 glyoxalase [Ktedonosporobacter rubrisoli]